MESGIPVPPGIVTMRGCEMDEVAKAAAELGYPLVLKPLVGSGSQGVRKVESIAQLEHYWAESRRDEWLLMEKFIEGSHHDINGLVIDGIFHPCGVADRFFGPAHYPLADEIDISPCLPVYGVCPTHLAPEKLTAAYSVVAQAACAIGIRNSPVKADLIWSPQGPVILEMAPRFHGEIVSAYLMPEATGQTPIKDWLRFLSTGSYGAGSDGPCRGAAWMAILPPRERTISQNAKQEIASLEGVAMLNWRFGYDTGLGPYCDNGAVRGLFVTRGDDSAEAAAKARATLPRIFAAMAVG
jgi:biotin carboxylase